MEYLRGFIYTVGAGSFIKRQSNHIDFFILRCDARRIRTGMEGPLDRANPAIGGPEILAALHHEGGALLAEGSILGV